MSEKVRDEVYAKIGHLSWPELAGRYAALEAKLEATERALRRVGGAISTARSLASWIEDRHAADGLYHDPGLIIKRKGLDELDVIMDQALAAAPEEA